MIRGGTALVRTEMVTAPKVLLAFFITLPLMFSFQVAGLRLSPVRLFLLLSFLPSLGALFAGRAGKIIAADVFMTAFAVWVFVSLLINDGMSQLPNAGMTAVELLGGYLLGRVLVRNAEDFRLMTRIYLGCLVVLLPFAAFEFLTGRILLHEIYAHLGQTAWKPSSSYNRWGFARTMSGFDHPILYGLFCSTLASTIFYVYHRAGRMTLVRLCLVGVMTFLSLSSAPLLSFVIQTGLVLWDKITRGRWVLLIVLLAVVYVALSVLSNRGPIILLISYATFDPWTAWTRIVQWDYGTVAVMNHPILGLGMGQKWLTVEKPWWITDSIDNFWLVIAMRHGLVGIGLLLGAIALLLQRVIRTRLTSEMLRDYRTGYVIAVAGLCFVLVTVDIWGAVSVFTFFFLGAGAWLIDAGTREAAEQPLAADGPQSRADLQVAPSYAKRFPPQSIPSHAPADLSGGARPMTRFAQDHVRKDRKQAPEDISPTERGSAGHKRSRPNPTRKERGYPT
jgi:hypothetical protein